MSYYISYFKHNNLVELITQRLSKHLRIDYSNGIRICAVASPQLSHCFNLIDRTRFVIFNFIILRFLNNCRPRERFASSLPPERSISSYTRRTVTPTPIYVRKSCLIKANNNNNDTNFSRVVIQKQPWEVCFLR